MLSLISMCLIVAVLISIRDKPLADWSLTISPNAVVSVLTTVGKASMMLPVAESISQLKWLYFDRPRKLRDLQDFDDASRGPWGSFTFLLNTRGRAIVASIGALITIIGLGFEPSAQQILSFPTRNVARANETATIAAAKMWQSKGYIQTAEENLINVNPDFLSLEVAIVNGLTGAVAQPMSTCTTSECHFPDFTSLAVCGACEDISHSVKRNCTGILPTNTINCTYTPPDSYYDSVTLQLFDDGSGADEFVGHDSTSFVSQGTVSQSDKRRGGFIALNMTSDTVQSAAKNHSEIMTPGNASVHTCSWSWCARTYTNASITNGNITSFTSDSVPLDFLETVQDGNIAWFTFGVKDDSSVPRFNVTRTADLNLWSFLDTLVSGNVVQQLRPSTPDLLGSIPQSLWKNNVTNVTMNIADTITNQLRGPDNLNGSSISGQGFRSETYVHVRWPWLILPVALTLLATILLITSIVLSARRDELFKSSSLALLYHGLDGWERDGAVLPKYEEPGGLEDVAKRMNAVLSRDQLGVLKFKKVS